MDEQHSDRCSLSSKDGLKLLTFDCSAGALQHGSQPDEAQLPPPSTLVDRGSALRYWEEVCFDCSSLQENRRLLRQHYYEAKHLGDQVTRPCIWLSLRASPAGSKPAAASTLALLLRCMSRDSPIFSYFF